MKRILSFIIWLRFLLLVMWILFLQFHLSKDLLHSLFLCLIFRVSCSCFMHATYFIFFGEMSNILIFNDHFFLHHVFFFQFPSFLLFSSLPFKLSTSQLGEGVWKTLIICSYLRVGVLMGWWGALQVPWCYLSSVNHWKAFTIPVVRIGRGILVP